MNLKLRGLPRWRKVELAQSIFGLIIITMVISTSIYYYYVPQTEASKEQSRTLKMTIGARFKGIHVITTNIVEISIWVIDENGDVDRTRNDVIEVTLAPSKILELKESKINLVQGEATLEVHVISEGRDEVLLTAVWVSGESYLEPASILIVYPPIGSEGAE
ncbi:hypothetical protein E2P64_04800 [Candidatus Bathyarchaeota archaeon]|nr:hypothetical protein E2P64_04800 [Candidatus Bathyarchaeota archaeon]